MIKPALKDRAFLPRTITAAAAAGTGAPAPLVAGGRGGFLIRWQNTHLLFDPYLSDSLTKKYAAAEQAACANGPSASLRRTAWTSWRWSPPATITPTTSDADTLNPLIEANRDPKVVVPAANQAFAADRLKVDSQRLDTINLPVRSR